MSRVLVEAMMLEQAAVESCVSVIADRNSLAGS